MPQQSAIRVSLRLLLPAAVIGIIGTTIAQAQAPAAAQPPKQFEAVSIQRNGSRAEGFAMAPTPGGFLASNVTALKVITAAYHLQTAQIIGGPGWLTTARYDITAKPPSSATTDEMFSMLQPLLADRFKLVVHKETRERPIYALVVGKGGLKLNKADSSDCEEDSETSNQCGSITELPNGVAASNISLSLFANTLGRILGERVVVDQTGIPGKFDITLLWKTDRPRFAGLGAAAVDPQGNSPVPQSVFTAIEEQTGLKLEAKKGAVEVLVIDHLERPSEN